MDLLLLGGLFVTALVATLTAVWVVPVILIAALAAAAESRGPAPLPRYSAPAASSSSRRS